jgi:peptide chain release factor 1
MQVDLEVEGDGCDRLSVEAGGHRVQRVPPTEKRGRVHTSTVTLAVMKPGEAVKPAAIPDRELQVTWFSGTGKGGQHRNKHQNSCRVLHIPTGLTETRQSREKDANLRDALAALQERLAERHRQAMAGDSAADRRNQVGSGMRGDKTVTIRYQDDTVRHHVTGRSGSARRYMAGEMDIVW